MKTPKTAPHWHLILIFAALRLAIQLLILTKSQRNASRVLWKNATLLTSNQQTIANTLRKERYPSVLFKNGAYGNDRGK